MRRAAGHPVDVSRPDGTKIWVTLTGHIPGMGSLAGAVLELPAF